MTEYQEHRVLLPKETDLPIEIYDFTKDENVLMLLIGCNAIMTIKTSYINQEKNNYKEEIDQELRIKYNGIIEEKRIENKTLTETYEILINQERERCNIFIQDGIKNEKEQFKIQLDEYKNRIIDNTNETKNYQDKIDKITKENQDYILLNVNKLNKEHQERLDSLNEELLKIRIDAEKQLIESKSNENRRIDQEVVIQVEKKVNEMQQNIELLNDNLIKYQEKIKILEIERVKTDEFINYSKREHENTVELEVNHKLKQKELDLKIEIEKYQDRIYEYEKELNYTINKSKGDLIENKMVLQEQYNKDIEKYQEKITELEKECINIENQHLLSNNEKMNKVIEDNKQLREAYNNLLIEKEQEENAKLVETNKNNSKLIEDLYKRVDEMDKKTRVSNKHVGTTGEIILFNLLKEAFDYHKEFEDIIAKANIPHSGDVIIKFKNFTILADSKVYKNGVDKGEREKIKKDLKHNQYIKVAWLVSLDNKIHKFSDYPIMYDIEDGVLYIYINSLLKQENPVDILRMAYNSSQYMLEKIINKEEDTLILTKYRKNEIRIRSIVEKMTKISRERDATFKQLRENFDDSDRCLRDLLNDEIMNIRTIQTETIEKWWRDNVKYQEGGLLKSNVIYNKFLENEDILGLNITEEMFKIIIKTIVKEDDLTIFQGKKTPYRIKNVCL